MDYNFIKAISQYIKMYKEFPLPVVICSPDFEVHWSNAPAQRNYPLMTRPDGLRHVLAEFDTDELTAQITERGNCTVGGAMPLTDTKISLSPIFGETGLAGIIAMAINGGDIPDAQSTLLISHTATALSESIRRSIDGIFTSSESAYLKALVVDSTTWLSPHLNRISANAYQILRTVANISEYSKLQRDVVILKLASVNLFGWLKGVGTAVSSLGGDLGIPVRLHIPPEDVFIRLDMERFELAFYNIIYNSFFFTRENNSLDISAEKMPGYLTVNIADKGQGMSPQILSQALRPYYSFPNRDGRRGAGLGLTLADRIIREHGGEFEIKSRLDEGTVVTITLPVKTFSQPLPLMQGEPDLGISDRFSNLHIGLMGLMEYI